MKLLPDNSVDLVVTDPPYGIGADKAAKSAADQRIKAMGKSKAGRGWKDYGESNWDNKRPTKEVFNEIIRVSNIQVIWGGNYFANILPPSMGWLFWDKGQRNFSLADGELAWTSEQKALRVISVSRAKALQDGKHHPTQKSLDVMKYCISKYCKPNDLILDPFAGSGTTLVAAKQLGRRFIGMEIEEKYVAIANERLKQEVLSL